MSMIVAEEYASSLSDLTVNSKPLINMLTMLAEENIDHAPAIVQAVEKHLQNVQCDIKLPVLYLIDSIVKNVGGAYISLFMQNIVASFCSVFEKVDERTRSQMYKLRQTWNDHFSAKKLYAVDVRVHSIDPAWPITAPMPTCPTSIHVNPRFFKTQSPSPSAITAPVSSITLDLETQCVSDVTMRDELLRKRKELIELQQKKLELELMQTKAKLEEQQKQLDQQTGSMQAKQVQQLFYPAPQGIGGNNSAVQKIIEVSSLPSISLSHSRQSSMNSTVTNVSSSTKLQALTKPTVRARDPRLAARAQQNAAPTLLPTHQEKSESTFDSLLKADTKLDCLDKNIVQNKDPKGINKPKVRNSSKSSSPSTAGKSQDVVSKPKPSSPLPTTMKRIPKLKTASKSIKIDLTVSDEPKNDMDVGKEKESSLSNKSSPIRKSSSPRKKKPPPVEKDKLSSNDKEKNSNVNNNKQKSRDRSISPKKKLSGSKSGDSSTSLDQGKNPFKSKNRTVEHGKYLFDAYAPFVHSDGDSPSPPPPPVISEVKIQEDCGKFKEVKISAKRRHYVRRNRESRSRSKSPLKSDVDLRVIGPPDKQQKLMPTVNLNQKAPVDEAVVTVIAEVAKDVDLRQLPGTGSRSSPARKRGSPEKDVPDQPPIKKSKAEMYDVLFGNEDVDLRQLPSVSVVQAPSRPSPPPPPTISHTSPPRISSSKSKEVATMSSKEDGKKFAIKGKSSDGHIKGNGEVNPRDWAKFKGPTIPSPYRSRTWHKTPPNKVDRLGRPTLFNRTDNTPGRRRVTSSMDNSGEDTDMRMYLNNEDSLDDVNMNISIIVSQAEEQLKSGQLSYPQYNTLLRQVIQLNEKNKLREAQRRDMSSEHQNKRSHRMDLSPVSDDSSLADTSGAYSPSQEVDNDERELDRRFGDIDDRYNSSPTSRRGSRLRRGMLPRPDRPLRTYNSSRPGMHLQPNTSMPLRTDMPTMRPDMPGRPDMAGRSEIPGRPDLGGRPDMPGRIEMGGRSDMPGRPDMGGRPDMPGRTEMSGRPDMPGRPDMGGRPDIPGRTEMSGRPDMPGRPDMGGRPDMPGRPEMAGRPDVTGWPDMVGRPEVTCRPDMPGWPEMTGRPEIAGRPDMTVRPDMLGRPDLQGRPEMLPGRTDMIPGRPDMTGRPIIRSRGPGHLLNRPDGIGANMLAGPPVPAGPGNYWERPPPWIHGRPIHSAPPIHQVPPFTDIRWRQPPPQQLHPPPSFTTRPPNVPPFEPRFGFGPRNERFERRIGPILQTPPVVVDRQEFPPADPLVLDHIAGDSMRTINIDNVPREIRFYGDTAIVLLAWDDPREIGFQGESRRVLIDDTDQFVCLFNSNYRDCIIDGELHKIKLGAPTRELYIDGKWYECFFGGTPVKIELGGKMRSVKLEGPPPQAKIGTVKRMDLCAGKINLIIDARDMISVFLDPKPQRFDIENKPHVLRFINALTKVLINGRPFDVEFGGLPKPIYVNGKKHFIRFSVLPQQVKPGYVTIRNMEGGRLPSPTLRLDGDSSCGAKENEARIMRRRQMGVSNFDGNSTMHYMDESTRDSDQRSGSPGLYNEDDGEEVMPMTGVYIKGQAGALEMLTSLMPSAMAPSSGFGYQIDRDSTSQDATNPSKPTETAMPAMTVPPPPISTINSFLPTNINVDELFQKLVATGIVPTKVDTIELGTPLVTSKEKNQEDDKFIVKRVDLGEVESLKVAQLGVVSEFYAGIQCNSCGVRFLPEQTTRYSQHLDWHFRQNRRGRDNNKTGVSRKWYYDVADWLQFEEIEDLEQRAQSWFEAEQLALEGTEDVDPIEIPSVPVSTNSENPFCVMCHDTFEQFYNEENEEWHFRMAVRIDDKIYHPMCYEDYKLSLILATEEPSGDVPEEIKNEVKEEVKEEAMEDSEASIEEIAVIKEEEVKIELDIKDEVSEESPELLMVIEDEPMKDYCEESTASEAIQVANGIMSHLLDSVALQLGFGDVKEEPCEDEVTAIEVDLEQVKIEVIPEEEESKPIQPAADTTHTEVVSSIDGNVQFEDKPPVAIVAQAGKIKINITKQIAVLKPPALTEVETEIVATEQDADSECEPVVTTSVSDENEEPPPPGVDVVPFNLLPAQTKQRLIGRNLTVLPTVMKGSELSGLCSIM